MLLNLIQRFSMLYRLNNQYNKIDNSSHINTHTHTHTYTHTQLFPTVRYDILYDSFTRVHERERERGHLKAI